MALAVAGIGGVAAVSDYLPTRRATTIDPMRELGWWVTVNLKPCVRRYIAKRIYVAEACASQVPLARQSTREMALEQGLSIRSSDIEICNPLFRLVDGRSCLPRRDQLDKKTGSCKENFTLSVCATMTL